MNVYHLHDDIKVFGFVVTTFPAGIGEAFNELIEKTGDGAGARNYYGLSECIDGKIIYYALVEEKFPAEAEKYSYQKLTIEKGEYVSSVISKWREKTECIKDVFHEIMQDPRVNKAKPAIEWYKDDHEMMCMVKMMAS